MPRKTEKSQAFLARVAHIVPGSASSNVRACNTIAVAQGLGGELEAAINARPITLHFAPRHPGPYTSALPDFGTVRWEVLTTQPLPSGVIAVTFKPVSIGDNQERS